MIERRLTWVFIAVLVTGWPVVGAAQAPAGGAAGTAKPPAAVRGAAPLPPVAGLGSKPAPELEQLKFLRGRWQCTGKQLASPMFGPEHRFTAVAEVKAAVDGFWDQFNYEERRSKEHRGFKAQGLWGWDQSAKHFIRVGATSAGDWDYGSAPGIDGDKIVWTGELTGPLGRTGYRQTISKKGEREIGLVLELKEPAASGGAAGKFATINEVDCKR
ncbi:MAG TPA: DUF1579 family protein [Polyangia bacterium]